MFDIPHLQSWMDFVETEAIEFAEHSVQEFYGVNEVTDLTEKQIGEIDTWIEDNPYQPICMGLRWVISEWEDNQ